MKESTSQVKLSIVPCQECGKLFQQTRSWARYCQPVCRTRYFRLMSARIAINTYALTVAEAAKIIGCSETTIRKRIKAGEFRTERILGRVLIYKSQIIPRAGK